MKTKAIVFTGEEKAELHDIEIPRIDENEVLVENLVTGVSVGTERWALTGKRPEMKFPLIPGYMAIGKILESGKNVDQKKYAAGTVIYYSRGRLPEPYVNGSWMSAHTGNAIAKATEDSLAIPLPEGLNPESASLAGLCAVAMNGIEMATIKAGDNVLVSGVGVIGQFAAQVCRLKGARVAVTDIVQERLNIAEENGAEMVINPNNDNMEKVSREFAPEGFDVIIDTSSIEAVVNSLWSLLKRNGKFILQGYYPAPTSINTREAALVMPTIYMPDGISVKSLPAIFNWMNKGNLKTENLLTHLVKPEKAPEIYDMINKGSENFLGISFDWRK